MDFQAIATLAFGVMVLAVKPGPGMLAVASRALGQGMGAVGAFVTGTNLVKILFFGLVVAGFTVGGEKLLFASILIKALAAVYLIRIGVKGLQEGGPPAGWEDLDIERAEKPRKALLWENFSAGFVLTLSNPFDILFFAGILPTILDVTKVGFGDFLTGAAVIVAADLVVAFSYAVPLALSRRLLGAKMLEKMNLLSSIAIILVGLIVGWSAIPAQDLMAVWR